MKIIESPAQLLVIYEEVLKETRKQFPVGTWESKHSESHSIVLTKYMLEDILGWSKDDVSKKLNYKVFSQYKLAGMLRKMYNGCVYKAYNTAYPGLLHPWEMMNTSQGFWNYETGIRAIKWLVEEKLQLEKYEIPLKLTKRVFVEYKLGGLLVEIFKNSPRLAIQEAYPGDFTRWHFKFNKGHTWTYEESCKAFRWLIEKELCLNPKLIITHLTVRTISHYGLTIPFRKYFSYDKELLYKRLYGVHDSNLNFTASRATFNENKIV